MTQFKRADRVGCVIKKELSELLLTKIQDPRLAIVTIMDVEVSDDLGLAKVYFSAPPGSNYREALAGFKSAYGFLRRELGARVELKYMPEIRFYYDDTYNRAAKLEQILDEIKKESPEGT